VEKFRLEMKNTDRNEDMSTSEVMCERGSNVQQEQSEYGPLSFQPENTPSAQREQPNDTSVMKQENMESDKQDQEDDSSQQGKGIYGLILQQLNTLIALIIFYMNYIER
jgi:hypothetical protein